LRPRVPGSHRAHDGPRAGCRHPLAQAEALDRTTDSGLLRVLRGLPDESRTAVYLADIEGYSYREIAEIMGTPVETVMSGLHRGRLRILEQLMAGGEHATRKRLGLDLGPALPLRLPLLVAGSGVGGPPGFMMIHELDSLTMHGFSSRTTVPPRTRE
jgi:hypothetical protein